MATRASGRRLGAEEPPTASSGLRWERSYRQAIVPENMLGRVMATYRVIAYGAMPIGAAAGGLVADLAGVRATFVAGAAAVTALLVYFLSPTRTDL